jgi:hypothetical protein
VGVFSFGASLLRTEAVLRRSRLLTGRYQLFATRDRLVRLVVDDAMSEADPLWVDSYGGVNDLLDVSFQGGLIRMINDHLRFHLRLARSDVFRGRFLEYRERLKSKAEAVPEFGETLVQMDRAVFEMCGRRTSRIAVRCYTYTLKLAAGCLALLCFGLRGMHVCLQMMRAKHAQSQFLAFHHRECMV